MHEPYCSRSLVVDCGSFIWLTFGQEIVKKRGFKRDVVELDVRLVCISGEANGDFESRRAGFG